MQAVNSNIDTLFAGARQYAVPVYQRAYSWGSAQCKRLWQDIMRLHELGSAGHFVGSVVNVAEAGPDGVHRFQIIDGQQRLATLLLLLAALRDHLLLAGADNLLQRQVIGSYLFTAGENRESRLLLGTADQPAIEAILAGKASSAVGSRLVSAYQFFRDCVAESPVSPPGLLDALRRLQMVNILLDRSEDDPQLIFESLNSTGLELSQSDLIRNYVLMGLPSAEQETLYRELWLPMENLFAYEKQAHLMDRFFRDFLTMQLTSIPKVDRVYEAFKGLYPLHHTEPLALCRKLARFANLYTSIHYCKSPEGRWDAVFRNIRALQMEVSYPFLMTAYADWEDGTLTDEDFEALLYLCESYVLRRAVCGMPTNSLNKTFASIKNTLDKTHYLDSVRGYFASRESYKEFPSDERFAAAFAEKDIYHMRVCGYILARLENAGREEPLPLEQYRVEPILPLMPNLSLEWRGMLGADWKRVQAEWACTVGNLALVRYGPETAERPFAEKCGAEGGIAADGLQLNASVKGERWDEASIRKRAGVLAARAVLVWPAAHRADGAPAGRHESPQYTLQQYGFNVFTQILYQHLDRRILALAKSITRRLEKQHIYYDGQMAFIELSVHKSRLRLLLNLLHDEADDPTGLCRATATPSRYMGGNIEIQYESLEQLDAVLHLVEQAYSKQKEI